MDDAIREILDKIETQMKKPVVQQEGETSSQLHKRRRVRETELVDKLRLELERAYGLKFWVGRMAGMSEKLDLLWKLAWDRGHSAGLHEVVQEYDEMVPLVKP